MSRRDDQKHAATHEPALPGWARILLGLVLPRRERRYVVGDVDEEYRHRRAAEGRSRATLWLAGEVLASLWPLLSYPGRWEELRMRGLRQDLKGALRLFAKAPGFVAVVVVTLGLAIGAASSVFSVVRGVLIEPMPFFEPSRVVMLWGETPEYPRTPLTVGDHNVLAERVSALETVSAAWSNTGLLHGEAESEQVSVG